ncbi:hypothetical protein MHU86_589 [Fragilaria crotonensis]|nr:hypothetical protein MHU86_589 [Fragilaria crotonensis]
MSVSSSAVDYSIGGRIDEVLSKRTTFSTLMRPEKEADENFLSTLYDADAGMSALSKESSHYKDTRVVSAMPAEGGYLRSKTEPAKTSLSNEDTIRRGYVDVMARWALTKDRSVDESLDTPSRVSSRSTPQFNFNESPAERMAARLRLAQEHCSDPLKMVASEGEVGIQSPAQEEQVRNRERVLGQERHVLSPVQKTQVGNREQVLEQDDQLSREGGSYSTVARPDRRLKVTTNLCLSPAERMAGRLRRAHQQGTGALVLVASDVEDKFEASKHLPALEEKESEDKDYNAPAAELTPIIIPVLTPAERMASRLLEARRLGNNGLVLVSSRDEKDVAPPQPQVDTGVDTWNDIHTSKTTKQFGLEPSRLRPGGKHGDSVESLFADDAPLARWDPNHPSEKSPIECELAVIRSLQLATTELNKLNGVMHVQAEGESEITTHNRGPNIKSWNGVTPLSVNTDAGSHYFDDSPATGRGDNLKEVRSGIQGLAASSKTGLQSALQEINRSFSEEKLWWSSKPLSPIRKAIEGSHRISEPTIRSDVDHEGAASKALSAADEELRKFLHPEAVAIEVNVLDEPNGDMNIKLSAASMNSPEKPDTLLSNETNAETAAISEVNEIDEPNGNVNKTPSADTLENSENEAFSEVLGGEKSIFASNRMSSNSSEKSSEYSIPSSADESSMDEDRLEGDVQDTRSAVTPPRDSDCFLVEVFSPVAEEVRLLLRIGPDNRLRTLPEVQNIDEPNVVVDKSSNTDTAKSTNKSIPPSSDPSISHGSTESGKTAVSSGDQSPSPTPNDVCTAEQSALVTAHTASVLCCFAGPGNTKVLGDRPNTNDETGSVLTETPPNTTQSDQSSTTVHDVATDNLYSSQNNTQAAGLSAEGQEIAEKCPTPPYMSTGWFCFTTSLAPRGTDNMEGAGKTGDRELSAPSEGTTDFGKVVPEGNMPEVVLPMPLKDEATTEQAIGIRESNPEDGTTALTSKLFETVSSGDLIAEQAQDAEAHVSGACAANFESTRVLSNGNVQEPGAQEIAERSPTPPDGSIGCYCLTIALDHRGMVDKEGAAETGAHGQSSPPVDTSDHRPMAPEEDMAEAGLPSVSKEEATSEPVIENGESNPEAVTPASTSEILHRLFIGPLEDMTKAVFTSVLKTETTKESTMENGDATAASTSKTTETVSMGEPLDDQAQNAATGLSEACGLSDAVLISELKEDTTTEPAKGTAHVTTAWSSRMLETVCTSEVKDHKGHDGEVDRSRVSYGNVHEAGAQEKPERSPTPPNISSSWFCITGALAGHDTSVKECPPETGATALSPHLVDAGGHRAVVPVEDMSEAVIASGLIEETIMQPVTENGESNPEDVAARKMIETVSAGEVLDSQGHDREPDRSNAHAAIIESTHESGAQETAERSVPSGCFWLTTLLTPHDTSVKECDAVTQAPRLVDATDHNPEDTTTTSTSTMLEALSPAEVIDNQVHAGEVDESTQLLSVALENLLSHGNTKAVTVSAEAQTSVATSPTPPSLSTGNLSFTASVAPPRGTQDKERAAEAPASALSPAFVEGTDHRPDEGLSEAVATLSLGTEPRIKPGFVNGELYPDVGILETVCAYALMDDESRIKDTMATTTDACSAIIESTPLLAAANDADVPSHENAHESTSSEGAPKSLDVVGTLPVNDDHAPFAVADVPEAFVVVAETEQEIVPDGSFTTSHSFEVKLSVIDQISVWEAELIAGRPREAEAESIHPFSKDETCETGSIAEKQRVMNDLIENVASADRTSPVSTVFTTDYRDRCTTPTHVFSGSCCGLSVANHVVASGTPTTTANEVVMRAPFAVDEFDPSDDCVASSTERENVGDRNTTVAVLTFEEQDAISSPSEAEENLEQDDLIGAWEAELLAFRTREADQVSIDEAVEEVLMRLKRRIEVQKELHQLDAENDETESHASSGEVCQVDSSKPIQALGEILGDVDVSEAKSLGGSVFSPEDGELVDDVMQGPILAGSIEVTTEVIALDHSNTVIDDKDPFVQAETTQAFSVVAESGQALALDAESTRPLSREATCETNLIVGETQAAIETFTNKNTSSAECGFPGESCAKSSNVLSGSYGGDIVAEPVDVSEGEPELITDRGLHDRLDGVEVPGTCCIEEIVLPPEELEEVLQRMLQRMNGEQERLEPTLDVTQETSIDEMTFPSDEEPGHIDEMAFPSDEEPEQVLQRALEDADDDKTQTEGEAQHEPEAEVQGSEERIVLAPEELEEVIQRILQRVDAQESLNIVNNLSSLPN